MDGGDLGNKPWREECLGRGLGGTRSDNAGAGPRCGLHSAGGGSIWGKRLTFGLVHCALTKCILWAGQVCTDRGFREDAAFALRLLSH